MSDHASRPSTTDAETLKRLLVEARNEIKNIQDTNSSDRTKFDNEEWAAALTALVCDAIVEQSASVTFKRIGVAQVPFAGSQAFLEKETKGLIPVSDSVRTKMRPCPSAINECLRAKKLQTSCYTHALCGLITGVLHSVASLQGQVFAQLDRIELIVNESKTKVASEHMRRLQYIENYYDNKHSSIETAVTDRNNAATVRAKIAEAERSVYFQFTHMLERRYREILSDAQTAITKEVNTIKGHIRVACAGSLHTVSDDVIAACDQHFVVGFLDKLHATLAESKDSFEILQCY